MEILNNIWMVLNSPNKDLVNIILMLATFVENYLIMTLFITILNIETTRKQKLIYILAIPLIGIIGMYIISDVLFVIFNLIIMIIFACCIFKISLLKSSISVICSSLVFALVGTLIANPYMILMQITSTEIDLVPIYRIIYLFLMYFLVTIIIIVLRYRNIKINFIDDIDRKTKLIISGNLILGILTFAIQLVITIYYTDILPLIISILSFISLLAYFSLSLYSLTRVIKLTLTTRKLESAEEYNKTLRILHDNVRGFKHDFDNIVTTIGGYVRTDDMEGLKSYYVQLEDDCQRVNNLYLLNPEIINNPRYLQLTH